MLIFSLTIAGLCLVICATILFKVGLFMWDLYIKWKAIRGLPRPYQKPHWFWGDLFTVIKFFNDENAADEFRSYIIGNDYKLMASWLGPFLPVVVINHHSLVSSALKLPKNPGVYDTLKPWLGDGLLISEGNKWFRNRRMLTPAFHYEILSPYVLVFNQSLEALTSKWALSAKTNEPVLLFESISLLSLDNILKCSFSFSSDCQTSSIVHPYIVTVKDLVKLTTERLLWPPYFIDWYYYLTPTGRKYKRLCKSAHDYSAMVIQNRKKELGIGTESLSESELRARKKGKYLDFLDVLLIARDEEGNGLTDQEIQDEVDTFLFEGHDTTTSGMCWTLYCLAKYPEHQQKVREEVASVLMGREQLEYDDLKELKYTQWCIKEAMRLYPPVFHITRESVDGTKIGDVILPKGVRIGIDIFNIHRFDPWENPDVYDPLRFHPSNCEGRDPFAYIPFSGGQRNCIGQNFALNEERVVVATIVSKFKLSLVEGHKVERSPLVVLRTKNDIKLKLEALF